MAQPSFYPAHGAPVPATNAAMALGCPWCAAPSTPSAIVQSCGRCGRSFTLSAGPALDGSIAPPPFHPAAFRISLRWSIVVTYRFATLEPQGITYGTLDPVVGMAPVDQSQIAYPDVVSIAVWRKLALTKCFAGALVPLPIALFAAYGAILAVAKAPGVAAVLGLIALAFGLLAAWLLHQGIAVGRRQARIVGRWTSFTVPFENSPSFYAELFRRCGLAPPPIP